MNTKRFGCPTTLFLKMVVTITALLTSVVNPGLLGEVRYTWFAAAATIVLAWRFVPRCWCAPGDYREEPKPEDLIPPARLVRGKDGRDA